MIPRAWPFRKCREPHPPPVSAGGERPLHTCSSMQSSLSYPGTRASHRSPGQDGRELHSCLTTQSSPSRPGGWKIITELFNSVIIVSSPPGCGRIAPSRRLPGPSGWEPNCQRAGAAAPTLLALVMLSPSASEPRSNKEPRACRPGTPLLIHAPVGGTPKRPRLRVLFWPCASRHPQRKPLRVPPIWRRQSAISLPGFSHPGGAASSAWFRGLLHRHPSAARTTEQRPISGQGILPCEVHAKFVKEQGTTGTTRTTGTPIGEALVPVVPVVLVVISFPFHSYIRVASDGSPVAPGLMAMGWVARNWYQGTSGGNARRKKISPRAQIVRGGRAGHSPRSHPQPPTPNTSSFSPSTPIYGSRPTTRQ